LAALSDGVRGATEELPEFGCDKKTSLSLSVIKVKVKKGVHMKSKSVFFASVIVLAARRGDAALFLVQRGRKDVSRRAGAGPVVCNRHLGEKGDRLLFR
jgi:hypothetical protein